MPITRAYAQAAEPGNFFVAGKNKIINGDFNINQRGFTSTTTSAVYTFDRWRTVYGGGTTTYSSQSFTLGSAPVAGYEARNFVRIVTASQSTTTDYAQYIQNIEDVRTFAGQTVTLSFWAKASTGTPSIAAEAAQNFGTGGSPSSQVNTTFGKTAITSSWARYSLTLAIPSISGKTLGTNNDSFLGIAFWTSAGSAYDARTSSLGIQNVTIDIWGVQVEAGSVATPFTTATGTLAGELAACQRYYEKSFNIETAPTTNSSVGWYSFYTNNSIANNDTLGTVVFKVTKRGTPTITVRPYATVANTGRVSDINGTDLAAGSGSAGNATQNSFYVSNGSGGTITTLKTGVLFHWEASAEL